MATVYKCPVCIWKSHQERFTARIIDDFDDGIAVGESKKEAIEHIIIEAFNKRFPKLVKSESVSEDGGGGGGGGGGSIFATE